MMELTWSENRAVVDCMVSRAYDDSPSNLGLNTRCTKANTIWPGCYTKMQIFACDF